MSLDVYLYSLESVVNVSTGIFVRENGNTRELTMEEVRHRYPDHVVQEQVFETNLVFQANITHNLNKMAIAAGIYEYLWRPEEINITTAKELIDPLREGLHDLKMNPDKYKEYNPENGWGTYEGLVNFVSKYLNACYDFPEATIEVCR
jgi:hypothetical protein